FTLSYSSLLSSVLLWILSWCYSVSTIRYSPSSAPVLFFFNHPPPSELYTLSLHDALPIFPVPEALLEGAGRDCALHHLEAHRRLDRKSTRLNSSHGSISYAVFCLKKKKIRSKMPRN